MATENCTYPDDFDQMTLGEQLMMSDWVSNVVYGIYACTPFKWQYLVNLLCVIIWLVLGRWLYDGYMRLRRRDAKEPFALAEQLTKADNKALAVDFASFLFSLCWITRGSLTDVPAAVDDSRYFGNFFVYQLLGYALIIFARFLNDKIILRKVDNVKAMVEDHNIGVACAQGGATIATSIILGAASGGVAVNLGEGVVATLIYYFIGQALLMTYALLSDFVTALPMVQSFSARLVRKTDDPGAASDSDGEVTENGPTSMLKQASEGNIAAGLSLGFDFVYAAILIAAPITVGYSLLAWLVYVGVTLLVIAPLLHVYLDHIIMRGAAYSVNIMRHKNWGAAVLLGCLKVLTALLLGSLYRENCAVGHGEDYFECYPPKLGGTLYEKLAIIAIPSIFNWQALLDLFLLLVVILFGKAVYFMRFAFRSSGGAYEGVRKFSLDEVLADPKNNAIAISLAAYSVAQGLALVGVAHCPNSNAGIHGGNLVCWTAFGCVLLVFAFVINDCVLLRNISNTDALRENNIAVALFEAGSFISCGLILRGNLIGTGGDTDAADFGFGFALISLYWVITQLVLLLFCFVYRCLTFYDDHAELKAANAAAGLSSGVTLVALAVVMAYPLPYFSSLLVILPIAAVGGAFLLLIRFVVDFAVLPGDRLDREIKNDKNWGAAVIEGAVAVGIAFVGNLYMPAPGGPGFDVVPGASVSLTLAKGSCKQQDLARILGGAVQDRNHRENAQEACLHRVCVRNMRVHGHGTDVQMTT
eukprot:CAMPEP_0174695264 /NCGR_PEP_ID=MMETSP1094-20130205/1675_1 /TAXON_ID=156173 /ORGANISM="Chrysochromulina brevifilum, Strain UTEX LB 985" /LENGTH=756 /DNA_ID=CAMNT_0015891717 /DNA_START=120 /DNA_END=2389 /DNA_ORIENTATION=+